MSFGTNPIQTSFTALAICSSLLYPIAGDKSIARGSTRTQVDLIANARVYVVAVRDSQLLTICPERWLEPTTDRPLLTTLRDGPVVVVKGIGPATGLMSIRVWETGENATLRVPPADARTWPLDMDRGLLTLDQSTASEIRHEIGRAGRFAVADALEDAEYVLLVEAHHAPLAYFAAPGGGAIMSHGDREGNFREALLALLVPAAEYRKHGPNITALLQAVRWTGASFGYGPAGPSNALLRRFPAEVESLIRYLHGSTKRPAGFPPVCAASAAAASAVVDDERWASAGLLNDVLAGAGPGRRGASRSATFQSGVTYVSVPVIVREGTGRAVAGLSLSDFRLFEGDTAQTIDRLMPVSAPITVGLTIDTSGSMRDELSRLQMPILRFLATLQPDDRVLLASFDTRVLLHAEATDGRERVGQALARMDRRGGTRLYDAVALLVGGRMQAIPERKALILLTDGVDTRSRLADAESTLRLIGQSHVPVYAIQYDTRRNEYDLPWATRIGDRSIRDMTPLILPEGALDNTQLFARADAYLASLTDSSGGRLYRAESLLDLRQAFSQVVKDLAEQYTLGYYPANQARDGAYRPLRVEVDRPGVTVTARAGYRAPSR